MLLPMSDFVRPQNAKEAQRRTFEALMRRGEPFPDRVMKEPSGRGAERRGSFDPEKGPARRPDFTAPQVDRFFLVGCSPYMFLQGTKSELLPPLTRDGYRLERGPGLKVQWDGLPQAEKDAYGFERETQDFLQRCVDEMDRRIREEQEALGAAGSTGAYAPPSSMCVYPSPPRRQRRLKQLHAQTSSTRRRASSSPPTARRSRWPSCTARSTTRRGWGCATS